MGSLAPSVFIDEREGHIAVRAYLDRSDSAERKYVSLASFAANDDTWAEFEDGWRSILQSGHIPTDYMHLKEAVHRQLGSPYSIRKGWKESDVWELIFRLVKFISGFDKNRLISHTCRVDMDAHKKLLQEGISVPSEIAICNTYVPRLNVHYFSKMVLEVHAGIENVELERGDLLHFIFDRNEPFYGPFKDEWNRELDMFERTGKFSPWALVDSVGEGSMKTTPGIQAADMLAWAMTREVGSLPDQSGTSLHYIIQQIAAGTSMEASESAMRKIWGKL